MTQTRNIKLRLGGSYIDTLASKFDALDTAVRSGHFAQNVAEFARNQVQNNLDGIVNYDGNDPGEVGMSPLPNGWRVFNRGAQVAFLEFGTGAVGGSGGHPGAPLAGYVHSGKTRWVYPLKGGSGEFIGSAISYGIPPQGQVWKAARVTRRSIGRIARMTLGGKVRSR